MESKHIALLGGVAIVCLVIFLAFSSTAKPKIDDSSLGLNLNLQGKNNLNNQAPEIKELQGQDTVIGTSSAGVVAGDIVVINYIGALSTGQIFDNSYDTKKLFEFQVGAGSVIVGMDKGILGMKIGGKRKLLIPASMGYGEKGQGSIPPNSALLFEVELMDIKKPAPSLDPLQTDKSPTPESPTPVM